MVMEISISQLFILALMTDLLQVRAQDIVLEIGLSVAFQLHIAAVLDQA